MRNDCQNIQPLFKPDELAKIYYEMDFFRTDESYMVNPFEGRYVVTPVSFEENGKIDITKYPCIFYKDGKCMLDETSTDELDLLPEFCKKNESLIDSRLEIIENLKNNKHFRVIKPFKKQDLKNINTDIILYYLAYKIQNVNWKKIEEYKVTKYHEYILAINPEKRVTAIRLYNLKSEIRSVNEIFKFYNKINKKLVLSDSSYIDLIRLHMEKKLNSLAKTSISDELILNKLPKEITEEYVDAAGITLMLIEFINSKNNNLLKYFGDLKDMNKYLNYLFVYLLKKVFGYKDEFKEDPNMIKLNDLILPEEINELKNEIEKVIKPLTKVLLRKK